MRAHPGLLAATLSLCLAACQSPNASPNPGGATAAQNAPRPVAPAAPIHAAPPASARAVTPVQAAASSPAKNTAPGPAIGLHGDLARGARLFVTTCKKCHGTDGKGGVPNKGSADGTIPPLAPIDPEIASNDLLAFRTNVDRFIEHGSRPDGPAPDHDMPAFGDHHKLAPQQIADVIAYVVHLNPPKKGH